MRYFKKILLLAGLLFLFSTSFSQDVNQSYFFQEVGWSITLPPDFVMLDLNEHFLNAQEDEEEDMTTNINATQTMVVAIKDRFNYFNVSISPFGEADDKAWGSATQSFKEQVYKSMTKNIGREQIDSASSIEFIDGLAFDKFRISIVTNKGLHLDMFLLAKCYKGYDFAITYLSMSEGTKNEIELMLKTSRFN